MQIPNAAKILIDTVKKENHEIYLVGGAVRDYFMNIIPKDYDFSSSASPEDIISMFRKTIKNGLKHGTISVILKNQIFEITTFRSNLNTTLTIEQDLSCRDFTINAMAWDFSRNSIIDPYSGQIDIIHKNIRTVGSAFERFTEDPHRIFRAARMASQLNFTITEEIVNTAPLFNDKLPSISHERVYDELIKTFGGINPEQGLIFLHKTKSFQSILKNFISPNIKFEPIIEKIIKIYRASLIKDSTQKISIYLYYIFSYGNIEKIKKWLQEYRFPHKTIELILNYNKCFLLLKSEIHKGYETRILLRNMKEIDWDFLFCWKKTENKINKDISSNIILEILNTEIILEKEKNPALEIKDLKLNGNEIMEHLNITAGKSLGKLLQFLLKEVLNVPEMNTKENLLKLSKRFLQEPNKS